LENNTGIAKSMSNIGLVYQEQGDYPMALDNYFKALKMFEVLENKKGIANNTNNIGLVYKSQGNNPKALDYFLKALKMYEELGYKNGIAYNTGNIGNVYEAQGEYSKALDYYSQALKMNEELGDKNGIAVNTGNIGVIYKEQHDYPKALDYYLKALKMNEELGNKTATAYNNSNIGSLYKTLGDYPKALDCFLKALKTDEECGDKNGIATNTGNIGAMYFSQKNYKESEQYTLQSLTLAKTIGALDILSDDYKNLSDLYAETGRWQIAFDSYKNYSVTKDSLTNKEKSEQLGKLEAQAEDDKKFALQQADEEKRAALAEEQSKIQKNILLFVIILAVAIALIAILIFRSLKMTRKQKALVDEKNKEITDSITYAKHLQEAILPPLSQISGQFPQSFVLYKPKDIVAGDFYWLEKTSDTLLIAAADCTGHGVPGAMVSVVCSTALNRAVKEFHIAETGKILDKVRDLVLETFEKSENNVQDGMDISLCSINTHTKQIQWSGANNPLWYLQNNELKEIKADKQPIGKTDNPMPFNTCTIQLQKGDTLYLFTDGYADQFGGPKDKKFKYKPLKEAIVGLATLSMEEQKQKLNAVFEDWKGKREQTDDVCIIGIRL
jgi:tetratricopeptide (TPR) repeat protein